MKSPLPFYSLIIAVTCFVIPMAASAMTLSDLVNLFVTLGIIPADKQEQALQAVSSISGDSSSSSSTSTSSGTSSGSATSGGTSGTGTSPSCYSFTRTLSYGLHGDDVSELQRYLASTGDYALGEVTGYYGSATQAAVEHWQFGHGVVSSGAASSTGYGVFGPQTRSAYLAHCTEAEGSSGNTSASSDTSSAPSTDNATTPSTTTTQSTSDAVTVSGTITIDCANTVGAGSYSVDFGDGWNVNLGTSCGSYPLTHTYAKAGSYLVTLLDNQMQVGMATMAVAEGAQRGSSTFSVSNVSTQRAGFSFSLTQASGASCTTPWGDKTVADGNTISSQPYFSNGSYSGAITVPLMSCSNGSWLQCDWQGNSCQPYVAPVSSSALSCSFNGQSIASGSSVTAYADSSVAYGSQCAGQVRTCSNGTLSGAYAYSSCTVQAAPAPATAAASCSFNGQSIASGNSVTAYQSSSVAYGSQCVNQTRSCSNGTLSGLYGYASCTVAAAPIASNASCVTPWGSKTVASGVAVAGQPYFSNGSYSLSAVSQRYMCTNESWTVQGYCGDGGPTCTKP